MYFSLCENCISLYVWFVFLIFRSNFFIWELFGLELVCCLPVSFLPSKSDWLEGQPFTKRLKHPTTFYRVFTTPNIGNTNTNTHQIDYCEFTIPDKKIWNILEHKGLSGPLDLVPSAIRPCDPSDPIHLRSKRITSMGWKMSDIDQQINKVILGAKRSKVTKQMKFNEVDKGSNRSTLFGSVGYLVVPNSFDWTMVKKWRGMTEQIFAENTTTKGDCRRENGKSW